MKEATESLPEQIKGTTPSHKLEDYTGTFEHPAYGTLQVYKQDDSLYVQFMEMDIQWGIIITTSSLQKLTYSK